MARKQEPNSVATMVGLLLVNNSVTIQDKSLASVSVMTCNLKKREEHKDKKFKIKQVDNTITVTRVL